jgi:ATP-dependent Clp protease ATP-binding subunit ClpC
MKPWLRFKFERLTKRARRTFIDAQGAAVTLGHAEVRPEHLLLALVEVGEGAAADALSRIGVQPEEVRAALEKAAPAAEPTHPRRRGNLPFAPESKNVLVQALAEAREIRHDYIGTEHLLVALATVEDTVASLVLRSFGATPERLRAELARLVESPAREEAGSRDNVVTCRVDDQDLQRIDALVEAGIRSTRSEAAAWLIHAGIEANRRLFDQVEETIVQIRRLKEQAQAIAQQIERRPDDDGQQAGPP